MSIKQMDVELLLRRLGVKGALRGCRYLSEAVVVSVAYPPTRAVMVTKDIYPIVARRFHTTPSRVERNMRHAIGGMWENGGKEKLEELTGCKYAKKPTNYELIDILSFLFREEDDENERRTE